MTDIDKAFTGSIPKLYDTLMVPMIFAPYATAMAVRVAGFSPHAVLETAAGSGAVTRELAPRLGAATRYVATDLNQPMLDYAAARQAEGSHVEWRQADAMHLPFEDETFDVVCCQFGAMFFPDRIGAYAEARRVLQPGGRFVFSVWDSVEENEFAAVVAQAVAEMFPENPPVFIARTPHGYFDKARIQDDLRRAGFEDVQIETHEEVSRAQSAQEAATAYCQGTPLRNEIEARDASPLMPATERAAQALADRYGAGLITGKIQAHVVTATK